MHTRKLALGLLVLLLSCQANDAGIVLNVDADVTADRTLINRLVVTVDGSPKEWTLTRPLPGSLGITTSAGKRLVTVDGFVNTVLRGRWSGIIDAPKGSSIVQDVHLANVALIDGGVDSGVPDVLVADGRSDRGAEASSDLGMGDGPDASAGDAGTDTKTDGGQLALDAYGRDGAGLDGPVISDVSQPTSDTAGPQPLPLSGAFAVRSPFDISASAAAPGPVRDAINLVHAFAEDPGAAIIDYADQAGVPAAAALRAALPSALMSRLTGWMNTYIKSAGSHGVVPYDRLVWLDDTVRALLLYWTLESRLALPVGTPGTHTPRTLIFTDPSGSPLAYPVDSALLTPATNVTSLVSWPGAAAPASVTISDHAFSLPFGRYALPALDAILLARCGTPNVAVYLSDAVGCADLAAYVASQCVSIVCVGHASDLTDLCEGGLAEGARQIDAQIQGLDFKAIHLQHGTATAIGAAVGNPQAISALQNGIWSVTVDFGNGPEPANASFSATVEAATSTGP